MLSFWIILIIILTLFLIIYIMIKCGTIGYNLANIINHVKHIQNKINIEDLINNNYVESGDLLLFSNLSDAISSDNLKNDQNIKMSLMQKITNIGQMLLFQSPITHVGMILRHPITKELLCVELQFGLDHDMVRISNLITKIKNYSGLVLYRPLIKKTINNNNNLLSKNLISSHHNLKEKIDFLQNKHLLDETNQIQIDLLENETLNVSTERDWLFYNAILKCIYCPRNYDIFFFFSKDSFLEYNKYENCDTIRKKNSSSLICTDFIAEIYYYAGVFLPLQTFDSTIQLTRIYPCDFFSICEDLPLNGYNWTFLSEYKFE